MLESYYSAIALRSNGNQAPPTIAATVNDGNDRDHWDKIRVFVNLKDSQRLQLFQGRFPLGGIFCPERNFLLFQDQSAERVGVKRQKKLSFRAKNIPPIGKRP